MRALLWLLVAGCNSSLPPPEGVIGDEGRLHFLDCHSFLLGGCGDSKPPKLHLMPGTKSWVKIEEHESIPRLMPVDDQPGICGVQGWIGPCCDSKDQWGICDTILHPIESMKSCAPIDGGPIERVFEIDARGVGECGIRLLDEKGTYEQLTFFVAEPSEIGVAMGRQRLAVDEIDLELNGWENPPAIWAHPLDDQGNVLVASRDFQFSVDDPTVAYLPNPANVGAAVDTRTGDYWGLMPKRAGETTLVVWRPPLVERVPIVVR